MTVAALLLAAGGSSRLGQPKQLVRFRGKTLVAHAAEQLHHSGCDDVLIVLGNRADQIAATVDGSFVQTIVNQRWRSGQASSLMTGLRTLTTRRHQGPVLVALCDQPLIPTDHYTRLINACQRSSVKIAATNYAEGGGVPACFAASAWTSLTHPSQPDLGAKRIIREFDPETVAVIDCPEATQDIDRPQDLTKISSVDRSRDQSVRGY